MVLPEFAYGAGVQKQTVAVVKTTVFILAFVFVSVAYAQSQQTAKKPWEEKKYGHFAQEEPLRELLYDFASSVSVPTIVSPNIKITVSGSFPAVSAIEYLAHITATYELAWVYDGTTLYFYDISEVERKTIELPRSLGQKFRSQVKKLGLRGEPLSWDLLPNQNIVQVSGPPRFVELISETVAWAVKDQAVETVDESYEVRVFSIKYAYVDEAMNKASGQEAKVTSLATMLGQIMNVSHINQVSSDTNPNRKLRGTGLVNETTPPPSTVAPSSAEPDRKSMAYITSYPRLNVIIVRDLESRMPTYEQLIRQLDIPQEQIQIQVTILDIADTDIESLGLNWKASGQRGDLSFSLNNSSINLTMDATTVGRIVARVSALQETGRSRIVSRPSVLTLDNREALFQSNQTFYVRLGTNEAVDLVPVSYGSVLRVRPHVIQESEERKIYLSAHVESGTRGSAADVTGVPEVSRTVIQTQAIISEKQSLLIGGYSIRERIDSKQRIPLLGSIPLLGRLFTSKHEKQTRLDRYFVITPTIVDATTEYNLHTGFDDINSSYTELLQNKGRSAN